MNNLETIAATLCALSDEAQAAAIDKVAELTDMTEADKNGFTQFVGLYKLFTNDTYHAAVRDALAAEVYAAAHN